MPSQIGRSLIGVSVPSLAPMERPLGLVRLEPLAEKIRRPTNLGGLCRLLCPREPRKSLKRRQIPRNRSIFDGDSKHDMPTTSRVKTPHRRLVTTRRSRLRRRRHSTDARLLDSPGSDPSGHPARACATRSGSNRFRGSPIACLNSIVRHRRSSRRKPSRPRPGRIRPGGDVDIEIGDLAGGELGQRDAGHRRRCRCRAPAGG